MSDWTCGADRDLPIDNSQTWDGDAAKAGIFSWAENADGEIQASKAKRAFLAYDASESTLRGSYKLPFAHLVSGSLKASPAGLRAAASRLPQTDGLSDATRDKARAVLDHYFDKLDEESKMVHQRGVTPTKVWKDAFPTLEMADVEDDRTARFIASTNSVDRFGDIVEQDWDTTQFWRNPVFLWGHASWQTPIGKVLDFVSNTDAGITTARVQFAPPNVDEFIDKLVKLVRLGMVRAVSVGFIPTEQEDRFDDKKQWVGYRFLRSQLLELSLCSVPANADAVALAKSVDEHPQFLRRVFSDMTRPSPRLLVPPSRELAGFKKRDRALAELRRLKSPAL